jgi:hypothetical protein
MLPANVKPIFTQPRSWRFRGQLLNGLALALGATLCVPVAAEAQYYGRWGGGYGPYGYYDGGPYGGPPPYYSEEEGPGPGYRGVPPPYDPPRGSTGPASRAPQPHPAAADSATDIVPLDVIRKRIASAGFRLIAAPRHKGNIYLAEVEDKNAIRHRLVYDAHDGHLIENTALGPVKKLNLEPEDSPKEQPKPDRSGNSDEQDGAVTVIANEAKQSKTSP